MWRDYLYMSGSDLGEGMIREEDPYIDFDSFSPNQTSASLFIAIDPTKSRAQVTVS